MAERLEGLVEGYRLNLQRLERLLAAYDLTPIPCLGRPVDAELMEVVQVVVDPTQPAGIVTDEIRRGYRRGGRVYRFAQVVATRTGSASSAPAIPTIEA
jgi:molecular chaperone GrpE